MHADRSRASNELIPTHIPGVKEWQKEWDERKRVQSHVLIHCVLDIWDQKEKYRVFNRSRQQTCQTEELWGQYGHTGTILVQRGGNTKLQSPTTETRKRPTKTDPKAMKKQDTRKRRSEMGKWWKRPRLDQTIPYRGLAYATRVSDELGSGADRFLSFSFSSFLFFLNSGRKRSLKWNYDSLLFFFSSIENKGEEKKHNSFSTQVRPGTVRYRKINE